MRLDGTEQIGADQHHLVTDAFWDTVPAGPKIISRLKIISYKDEVERFTSVGDGTNLWNLDLPRNEYSVSTYGSFTSKQPDSYQDSLLQSAVAAAKGAAVFPARLLRDIYASAGSTFKTWTPGTTGTQTAGVITYSVGNPLIKQVTFVLDENTGTLLSMSYLDTKGAQQVSWTLNFYSFLTPPPDWNFDFTPPAGSKPLVSSIH